MPTYCPYCGRTLTKTWVWKKPKNVTQCSCRVYMNDSGIVTVDALGDINDKSKPKKKRR